MPAWQAQMAISECQWLGVAMDTASTSLLSSSVRMSMCFVTWIPAADSSPARLFRIVSSTSQSATTRTPGIARSISRWWPPLPRTPITPTRMASLAPSGAAHAGRVSAPQAVTPPATVCARKLRRLIVSDKRCIACNDTGTARPCREQVRLRRDHVRKTAGGNTAAQDECAAEVACEKQ